jgi:hypothetical protein
MISNVVRPKTRISVRSLVSLHTIKNSNYKVHLWRHLQAKTLNFVSAPLPLDKILLATRLPRLVKAEVIANHAKISFIKMTGNRSTMCRNTAAAKIRIRETIVSS